MPISNYKKGDSLPLNVTVTYQIFIKAGNYFHLRSPCRKYFINTPIFLFNPLYHKNMVTQNSFLFTACAQTHKRH